MSCVDCTSHYASIRPQRNHWIDPGGAPGWNVPGDCRNEEQQPAHGHVRDWIAGGHAEQQLPSVVDNAREAAMPDASPDPASPSMPTSIRSTPRTEKKF